MNKIIERRLEFLKLEANGFSLCEIVKFLAEKYHKTERSIYYDATTRGTWQPLYTQLLDLEKARLIILNRYDQIYRKASFNFMQSTDSQKPQYLKIMLDVTNNLLKLLGLETLRDAQNQTETSHSLEKLTELLELKSSEAI